jgi:hypothetical protein
MRLGELLVRRYQLITKDQLDAARARQRESPPGRTLGEVLVEMGLVTQAQLQEALDYQGDQREDPWRDAF